MKERVSALSLALLCLCLLVLPARADMGPKPDLTITVVNAPEGACYVDLLYEGGEETLYTDLSTVDYDPELLSALHSLEGDGWVLACATGTSGPPIFGGLLPNDAGQYVYSYFGLPQTFRLAVATQDGAQATEESYTRVRFHTNLVYDWSTNTLSERASTPVSTPSGSANPRSFRSIRGRAPRRVSATAWGRHRSSSVQVTPGR